MKFLAAFFSLVLLNTVTLAEDSSGCLVRMGKKIVVDPQCKCVEKKLCVTPKKLVASKKFFDTKDANDKKIFSDQEKKAYEETYKLMNQIMELKAQGKGNSPEIKKHYFQLDKVNSELAILLHKNHPKVMASATKRNSEKSKARKERNIQREAKIKAFLENQQGVTPNSKLAAKSEPEIKKDNKPTGDVIAPAVSATVTPQVEVKAGELSQSEKKFILQNVKKETYDSNEDDSLFEIISKTYKKNAYPKLLEEDLEKP